MVTVSSRSDFQKMLCARIPASDHRSEDQRATKSWKLKASGTIVTFYGKIRQTKEHAGTRNSSDARRTDDHNNTRKKPAYIPPGALTELKEGKNIGACRRPRLATRHRRKQQDLVPVVELMLVGSRGSSSLEDFSV